VKAMDKLVQTEKFVNKRIYELTDNGMKRQVKRLFDSSEYFTDYEDIGVRLLKSKSGYTALLVVAMIGLCLSGLLLLIRAVGGSVEKGGELVYLVIGAVSGLVYWLTYTKSFYLVQPGNQNPIEFISDKPNKNELEKFIEALKEKRKKVLDDKYGQMNKMLPYEQNHQNLIWLFNNDVISKEEFDIRLADLNAMFRQQSDRKIGFDLAGGS
jgi:hypothetical protein